MESNVRQLADEDTIIFRAEVPEPSVFLDRSVLFRILENLLQNAMRYRKKQVIVEVSRKGRLLLITVQDDGNGFSGETLRRAAELPGGILHCVRKNCAMEILHCGRKKHRANLPGTGVPETGRYISALALAYAGCSARSTEGI